MSLERESPVRENTQTKTTPILISNPATLSFQSENPRSTEEEDHLQRSNKKVKNKHSPSVLGTPQEMNLETHEEGTPMETHGGPTETPLPANQNQATIKPLSYKDAVSNDLPKEGAKGTNTDHARSSRNTAAKAASKRYDTVGKIYVNSEKDKKEEATTESSIAHKPRGIFQTRGKPTNTAPPSIKNSNFHHNRNTNPANITSTSINVFKFGIQQLTTQTQETSKPPDPNNETISELQSNKEHNCFPVGGSGGGDDSSEGAMEDQPGSDQCEPRELPRDQTMESPSTSDADVDDGGVSTPSEIDHRMAD